MTRAKLKSPALDPAALPVRTGSIYPPEFAGAVAARAKRILGDPLGLTQFGVNLVTLPPGTWSSQRHWHTHEDEFVYVLEGEIVLVTDEGEQVLTAGTAAGFPASSGNGHCLVNRTAAAAVYLEMGTRHPDDEVAYPDIDMRRTLKDGKRVFTRKDGTPFDPAGR
jgi:uncharacterized cupin superfamily protein